MVAITKKNALAFVLSLVLASNCLPLVAHAEDLGQEVEDSECVSQDDSTNPMPQGEDYGLDPDLEPDCDKSTGAFANSWRFQNGMPNDYGIATLSSGTNSWWKEGNDWVSSDGTRVSGAKAFGIDVSQWQGKIDWASVKNSGVDYAIIRCGWGDNESYQDDKYFIQNIRGCQENGIAFGVYIYSYAYDVSMARSEADHVLRLLNEAGLSPSSVGYPIFYDLENEAGTGKPCGEANGQKIYISNATLADMATAFCSKIEDAGYDVGVYANTNWWNNYLTDSAFDNWGKWVAQYNYFCSYQGRYDMWQCMSDGNIPGISGNVDINFDFAGLEDFGTNQKNWERIYGQNQLDTMQEISKAGWDSSDYVVIATDAYYWDALSASSLAGVYDCPILLTGNGSLSSQAASEISRLGAKTAFVCGGPVAISSSVDDQIKAAGCASVIRVYGQDQQGTSRAVAKQIAGSVSDTCIIATSYTFQDALSISPYAYKTHSPIILCDSGSNVLSDETLNEISELGFKNAVIVGGPVAVSSKVEGQLTSDGVGNVTRVFGQTEYETSLEIAKFGLDHGMTASHSALATGITFYDALAGSALCGKVDSVLLIASDANRVCVTDFIANHRGDIEKGFVFGGPVAVSDSVWRTLMRSYYL